MLTSTYPAEFAPRHFLDPKRNAVLPNRASDRLLSVAEILADHGYRTASVSTNLLVSQVFNVAQGFEVQLFDSNAQADWVVDRAIEQLDAHARTDDRPLFLYLHFNDVHGPQHPPAPFSTMFPVLGSREEFDRRELPIRFHRFEPEELGTRGFREVVSYANALYDGSLRFVDTEIGRLVDHLRKLGLYENSIVAIAADHGESLWDRPRLERKLGLHHFLDPDLFGVGHGQSLFPELIEVPLVLHGRGVPRGRIPQQVRNLDVVPTLLALAGLGAEEYAFRGVDLVGRWERSELPDLPAVSETRTKAAFQRSLQDVAYQYMRLDGRELLFDRGASEAIDVSPERADLVARYRQQLDGLLEGVGRLEGDPIDWDSFTLRGLRELGYVE